MNASILTVVCIMVFSCVSSLAFIFWYLYVIREVPLCRVFVTTFYIEVFSLDVVATVFFTCSLSVTAPKTMLITILLTRLIVCQQVFICSSFVIHLRRTLKAAPCPKQHQFLYHVVPWTISATAMFSLYISHMQSYWWMLPCVGHVMNAVLIASTVIGIVRVSVTHSTLTGHSQYRIFRAIGLVCLLGGVLRLPLFVYTITLSVDEQFNAYHFAYFITGVLCVILGAVQTPAIVILYLYNKRLGIFYTSNQSHDTMNNTPAASPVQPASLFGSMDPLPQCDQLQKVTQDVHMPSLDTLQRVSVQLGLT